jgi:hypothetical protein
MDAGARSKSDEMLAGMGCDATPLRHAFGGHARLVRSAVLAAAFLSTGVADVPSAGTPARERLTEDVATALAFVAASMEVRLDPAMPLPALRLASQTPLARFQDAIARQWGFRPHIVVNAYAVATNEIFLDDSADYYRRNHRTLDDSLVHELVHYVQVRYRHDDLADESCEVEAVSIQTAYRDRHAPVAATPRAHTGVSG